MSNQLNENQLRILRIFHLTKKIGLGRSAIYDRLDPQSPRHDPTFPQPINLGGRAVGFVEAEVDAWLASQINKSRPQA
jgi:prophage regulatory protein